ncbi:probable G-protein coupled receptor 34 [Oncorhynchus nerka]|uniref:probable G-protein coupled receptor 34 n=1 Tax=Oncorhynchus nerka TaxID=8023 RepID=UPI0031B84ADC
MTTFPSSPLSTSSPNTSLPLSSSSFPFSNATYPPFTSSSPNQTLCNLDDSALRLPLVFFYSLFFLLGLVGNLLALWVFVFLHSRRNSVRVFLINVAIADLVLLACLPFRVLYHANGNRWVLGPLVCKVVGNLFYMNMYISITLLGFISLDRYVKLKGRGGARRLRGGGWSWVACRALWGLSLAAAVPMIAMSEGNEEPGKCFQYKQRRGAKGKAYFNMALVLLFWGVFCLLVVSYGKIAMRLLKVSRDKPDLPNAHRYGSAARKSFFVLFLFTVCFGPYHAFRPFYVLSQLNQSPSLSSWADEERAVGVAVLSVVIHVSVSAKKSRDWREA